MMPPMARPNSWWNLHVARTFLPLRWAFLRQRRWQASARRTWPISHGLWILTCTHWLNLTKQLSWFRQLKTWSVLMAQWPWMMKSKAKSKKYSRWLPHTSIHNLISISSKSIIMIARKEDNVAVRWRSRRRSVARSKHILIASSTRMISWPWILQAKT